MLDLIMRLLGYENIKNIKIPENYRIPGANKIRCKMNFYTRTGTFQDKVIINKNKELLDGYITYMLCKWADKKYIKVLEINNTSLEYTVLYRGYRLKSKEKREE